MELDQFTTVFLDMDGTLLDLHFDFHFWNVHLPERLTEIHGADHDISKEFALQLEAKQGTLDWYCTDHWSQAFSVNIMALKRELSHLIQYRPGTTDFLEHLADVPVNVVLLTNAHPDVVELKHEITGLLDFFDDQIISHHLGHPKESELFWKQLKQQHEYAPESTLLIDDSRPVLEAARNWGTAHQLMVSRPNLQQPELTCTEFDTIDNLHHLVSNNGPN